MKILTELALIIGSILISIALCALLIAHVKHGEHTVQSKPLCTNKYTTVGFHYFYMDGCLFHGWHHEEVFTRKTSHNPYTEKTI